jgi:endonuclease III
VELTKRILKLGAEVSNAEFFPALRPGASEFALADPFAFLLACVLDRGAPSKRIWSIPMDLHDALGHLDAAAIADMSEDSLGKVLDTLEHKPRYTRDAPKTILGLATLVRSLPGGEIERLWRNRTAADVRRDLLDIPGVGLALANMTVLLIERAFGAQFGDDASKDIKADVHTMRVLCRLGYADEATPEQAIAAARMLNPANPGALDAGLWLIGNRWCGASRPRCEECALQDLCSVAGRAMGQSLRSA